MPGDYVIREGEPGEGVYFIWDGQAEVSGPANAEEERKLWLKQYDYFAHGTKDPQVDVIAMSKLICLVLQHGNRHLLEPKSIWNADGTPEDFSLVERILHLEPLEVNLFRGITLPDAPVSSQVFGGQLMGHLHAGINSSIEECGLLVHSLHVSFIAAGDNNAPIIYRVHRARDGKSFATRRVEAIQHGVVIFSLVASFQKEEVGFEHQEVLMPQVPDPETLPSMEELRERRLTDPRLPTSYRNHVARKKFVPYPVEIRFAENNPARGSLKYWFKARGKLSDDPALHRCVVAYASDLIFPGVSLNPHRKWGERTSQASLDHSMWFHRPISADDWILYVIESPSAYGGRGFIMGKMFNRKGELVVSVIQEALIRKVRPTNPPPPPPLKQNFRSWSSIVWLLENIVQSGSGQLPSKLVAEKGKPDLYDVGCRIS